MRVVAEDLENRSPEAGELTERLSVMRRGAVRRECASVSVDD
jgi:hypothetical protein